MDRLNKSLIACVLFMSSYYGFSQQYPVQVTTTLAPPYSLYLSDYTAIGSNNLQVLVNLLELDRPNLQIKFRITIEGAGITLRTSPAFMPRPLNIQGGVPELFTGADLTSYFNPDHLDFTGITRAAFKRSGQLPEGFYTFTLEVLEYNRNVRISNQSISYAWIVLNDPPLLNTPFNGDKLIATDPQNIMFSWTPRHMASPNAAFSTEYEFRFVEMYPGQTNPDIAIRSSNSIYTTTTNLTSLNYGIIEPTLMPGKRYAFRVRAYDTSGRDLFKNDGYSETYVFQYGDACGTFEGIAARTLDPQRARISWEPEQHHTGGVINYRKKGKEEWFTQDVNGSYGIVAQLAGQTTYEYQLTPQCGTILGEKSPMMTFTTPEVDESGFVCGAPIPEFNGSDIPLMKPLLPLDVIQVGDWTVNLLNVSANGDGTYGGAGYAAVPNFNLANVRVVFDRILVNEDYQVVAGDIKTVYSEDSRFVLDIKKKEEEPEVVEVPEDDSNPDLTEDMVADILTVNIEGDIGEVIFSGGLLEVYDEAGNLIEDTDLDLPPEGEELTIMDSNGDTWVVDSEGGVREVQGDESSTPEYSEVDFIVHFKATEESSYGFDAFDPDIPQLRHFYQNVLTINDEEYVPAWKSVPVGMPDQVIAVANENEFPENMKFRSSTLDLEPMAGQQDNEKHLSVIGKAHGDIDVIEAYQKIEDEENVAGRINVVSYEKIYKTLEVVPVNGASIEDIDIIGDRINRIFQQAAVEWKVEAAEPFMVDPKLLENFDEGESGMLASFPDKMQQFNREFKRSRPVDKETYYIFVINEGSASLSGFMPFKRQFGYVFTKNTTYTNKTIAHELAHGAFRLRHTFSSAYGIPQRSTDNLMDYNGDHDKLKKFQWDLIHDPENLVGWFEDDEESALEGLYEYNYVISDDETLIREKTFPHGIIEPRVALLPGLVVALENTIFVNENTLIAKIRLKSSGKVYYTKYSNIEEAIDIESKKYIVTKNRKILETPYGAGITDKNAEYIIGKEVFANKSCGKYVKINSSTGGIQGHWIALAALGEPLTLEELALVDDYKTFMNSDVANNFTGFVSDFRKDGYFTNGTEPLTWMEEQGLKENTVTFLGMEVSRIITPFKEVLEETEKNFKADYPDAYNSLVTQLNSIKSMQGQTAIRYIANECSCNPSNHSLGAAIDIRPALNPQITYKNAAYISFIKYLTGLDLTKSKTDQQVVTAQEEFMIKIHGQKTKKYDLANIIADYEDVNSITKEFDLLAKLKDQDVEIMDFQKAKADLVAMLNAHKNRVVFETDTKAAIDEMNTYLNSITTGNTITKKVITNWDKVVTEKITFLEMVKSAGFSGLDKFILYFGKGQLDYFNVLLENGFGELPIELVKSFHKAHQVVSLKYNGVSVKGEWGGSYDSKYDGMHFGLRTSFIKSLTNKQE